MNNHEEIERIEQQLREINNRKEELNTIISVALRDALYTTFFQFLKRRKLFKIADKAEREINEIGCEKSRLERKLHVLDPIKYPARCLLDEILDSRREDIAEK